MLGSFNDLSLVSFGTSQSHQVHGLIGRDLARHGINRAGLPVLSSCQARCQESDRLHASHLSPIARLGGQSILHGSEGFGVAYGHIKVLECTDDDGAGITRRVRINLQLQTAPQTYDQVCKVSEQHG